MPCLYCASVGGCPIGWEGKGREVNERKFKGRRRKERRAFEICYLLRNHY
jgi:hypothetical protein